MVWDILETLVNAIFQLVSSRHSPVAYWLYNCVATTLVNIVGLTYLTVKLTKTCRNDAHVSNYFSTLKESLFLLDFILNTV